MPFGMQTSARRGLSLLLVLCASTVAVEAQFDKLRKRSPGIGGGSEADALVSQMDTIRVKVDGANSADMQSIAGVSGVRDLGQVQELRLVNGANEQQVLAALMQLGTVRRFEIAQPSLQDIFLRIARPRPEEMVAAPSEATASAAGAA